MSTLRYSIPGAKLALAALIAGSAALLAPVALQAAPAKTVVEGSGKASGPKAAARKADDGRVSSGPRLADAANDPQYTSALGGAATEEGGNCQRSRRKLWVDGEGWIVRRVTICP